MNALKNIVFKIKDRVIYTIYTKKYFIKCVYIIYLFLHLKHRYEKVSSKQIIYIFLFEFLYVNIDKSLFSKYEFEYFFLNIIYYMLVKIN